MKISILILFPVALITSLPAQAIANSPPVVSNVTASQRTDGSMLIDIYYDLADPNNDACTVSVEVSDDDGSTWDVPAVSFTGDIGEGITPDTGKHIIWDSGRDLPGGRTNYSVKVKVTAVGGVFPPGPEGMVFVAISEAGFNGEMSKYETTNAQYCQFLNAALASGDVIVDGSTVTGANGSNSGADFVGQVYYYLAGSGYTFNGATNGGAARINYTGSSFTVDSGFEYHPVTYVSWYGSMAFCNYYGWRLPTEWEWQAVVDHEGEFNYGCGPNINNNIANYYNSTHPDGTTVVGSFGTYGYEMCDMAGNVWEWTSSCSYVSCSLRVFRGGCWVSYADYCTVSRGTSTIPFNTNYHFGFRVCR